MAKMPHVAPPPGLEVLLGFVGLLQNPDKLGAYASQIKALLDQVNAKIDQLNITEDASKIMDVAAQKMREAEDRLQIADAFNVESNKKFEVREKALKDTREEDKKAFAKRQEEQDVAFKMLDDRAAGLALREQAVAEAECAAKEMQLKADSVLAEAETRLVKIKQAAQSLG